MRRNFSQANDRQSRNKRSVATKNDIENAKRSYTGNAIDDMRERGSEEPMALVHFTDADRELLPETGMKMRELTEQSHNNYLAFKQKQAQRKVRNSVEMFVDFEYCVLKISLIFVTKK